jgi:hypothetical protein
MPEPWQYAFTALVRRYEQAFTFQPQAESYQVTAGTEREVGCLDEAELKAAGIEKVWDEAAECHRLYRISDAVEIDEDSSVFLPGIDPVPYYKRGHGRVGPDPTAAADLAVANSARG